MSIVDSELARLSATYEGLTWYVMPESQEIIALARKLEAHCEAMAAVFTDADINLDSVALQWWEEFKQEKP